MDVETDRWCENPSISFEEKGLSPNEGNGLKSLYAKIKLSSDGKSGAVGVKTKLLRPNHSQFVNSIGACFDIEMARTRANTRSDAGWSGQVEDELGTR